MEFILDFLKKAIAALLKILGVEDDGTADNLESAVKDVVEFGKDAAAE